MAKLVIVLISISPMDTIEVRAWSVDHEPGYVALQHPLAHSLRIVNVVAQRWVCSKKSLQLWQCLLRLDRSEAHELRLQVSVTPQQLAHFVDHHLAFQCSRPQWTQ